MGRQPLFPYPVEASGTIGLGYPPFRKCAKMKTRIGVQDKLSR
jgi:hypothetical protein